MNILLSNDDGIGSPFLAPLAETLSACHEVVVAAPDSERSWIGKAMSRHGTVNASKAAGFPCPAYALSGTPSDCVNIALGHLCDTRPDCVISGINIGHNAGLSFIASSGTIGAALEGAFQNIHSIAASMYLDPERFVAVSDRTTPLTKDMDCHVRQVADFIESFIHTIVESSDAAYGRVHSLNFPTENLENATLTKGPAARTVSAPLFERDGDEFRFSYNPMDTMQSDSQTDREIIHRGNISHTIIDFTKIDDESY